jgi:hypothetical protein
VVGTFGSCDERIGGVIMVHSVVESRNRDDQGSRTADFRVRAKARATNDTAIDKGEDADIASIRIGTYNIRNGRAGNLEGGLRAMNKMNMDIVLFTETKLTDDQHTKKAFGYDVVATKARSKAQGGVAQILRVQVLDSIISETFRFRRYQLSAGNRTETAFLCRGVHPSKG